MDASLLRNVEKGLSPFHEEIVAAAKAAKVDYFIRTMPHGYDTTLDNEGSNLSQGQRQLLTIRDDDKILYMEHGTILEQGTHDELLVAGGKYAALYNSQFE